MEEILVAFSCLLSHIFFCQVHVSGAGDFQLCKIEVLKDPFPLNSRKNQDLMDSDEMHDVEVWSLT
jgi:hypothetical protein